MGAAQGGWPHGGVVWMPRRTTDALGFSGSHALTHMRETVLRQWQIDGGDRRSLDTALLPPTKTTRQATFRSTGHRRRSVSVRPSKKEPCHFLPSGGLLAGPKGEVKDVFCHDYLAWFGYISCGYISCVSPRLDQYRSSTIVPIDSQIPLSSFSYRRRVWARGSYSRKLKIGYTDELPRTACHFCVWVLFVPTSHVIFLCIALISCVFTLLAFHILLRVVRLLVKMCETTFFRGLATSTAVEAQIIQESFLEIVAVLKEIH